jgi:hypothetical protein
VIRDPSLLHRGQAGAGGARRRDTLVFAFKDAASAMQSAGQYWARKARKAIPAQSRCRDRTKYEQQIPKSRALPQVLSRRSRSTTVIAPSLSIMPTQASSKNYPPQTDTKTGALKRRTVSAQPRLASYGSTPRTTMPLSFAPDDRAVGQPNPSAVHQPGILSDRSPFQGSLVSSVLLEHGYG